MYGIPDSVKPLSAAEEQVMLAVWACRAPVTRRDIDAKLRAKGWAPATVLNFLYRLEEKGWVKSGKDFLGNRPEIKVSTNGSHALFAIITPTIHKDGSASYCEVAQSGIAPKDLGKTFNIQHYYIVKIEFKSF